MNIAGELRHLANEIARSARERIGALREEEAAIDARKTEIRAECMKIRVAAKRAFNFRPQLSADFQCPRCWIDDERRAILLRIGDGAHSEYHFRCETCGFDYTFALK
jgi:hypothetical protein